MVQTSHREKLIEGAITCLQEKGYARTTARDIARASGANLASIGYHFGSKDALLDEALIRILEQRNRYVAEITFSDEGVAPLDRLRAAFTAVRSLFEPFRPLLVAFVEALAQAERSPELRDRIAANYREARSAIGTMAVAGLGASAGRLQADPDVVASFLMATFDGLMLQWLLDPDGTPEADEIVSAWMEWIELVLNGAR